jgi:diguanylate cyclase (GGDEF)-like protein
MPIVPKAVDFTYTSSAAAPAGDAFERQAIGRIAAGVWAAIAFFGALATVEPLRFPEMDLSATRIVVLSATAIAAVTFVVPWARAPKAFVNLLLVLMAGYITALAYSSGAVSTGVMSLVTFAVALAVCFLPVRTSVAQVVMIAVLLAAGLILIDKENAGVDALRTSLMLSVLLVLCGLVLILRAVIAEREAIVGHPIFDTGLLDADEFDRMLDRELARATRHERPLSVVLIEVSGAHDAHSRPDANDERVVAAAANALLDRVRAEDSAGHLGGLRFAVIAPETPAAGAASVAETASGVIRDGIESLGYDSASFDVASGWAEYPHHADTRSELFAAAQHNLEAAAVQNELRRPSPTPADASPSTRPASAPPDHP